MQAERRSLVLGMLSFKCLFSTGWRCYEQLVVLSLSFMGKTNLKLKNLGAKGIYR